MSPPMTVTATMIAEKPGFSYTSFQNNSASMMFAMRASVHLQPVASREGEVAPMLRWTATG